MLVSIDVGIKRLGVCVLEGTRVVELCSIDLSPQLHAACSAQACGRATAFMRGGVPWCRRCAAAHADHALLRATTRGGLRHMSVGDLRALLEEWSVAVPKYRADCLKAAQSTVDARKFFPWKAAPASKVGLVEVGRRIQETLDVLHDDAGMPVAAAIENQIGPASPRMKGVQCMVAQYYIMRGVDDVVFVASTNKLRGLLPPRSTYAQRKRLAITKAAEALADSGQGDWLAKFAATKRADGQADMADAYLQGLWVGQQ
jgi:hypothetical protein